MAELAPWQKYLASSTGAASSRTDFTEDIAFSDGGTRGFGERSDIERAEVSEEEKRGLVSKAAASFLGLGAEVGKQTIGALMFVQPLLGVIGRGMLSTSKEIGDALWQVSRASDKLRQKSPLRSELGDKMEAAYRQHEADAVARGQNYTPSLRDWWQQTVKTEYAQDVLPSLYYDPKTASQAEKTLKEAAGFLIDIRAAGGFRGGVRTSGIYGRKRSAEMLLNQAHGIFTRNAARLANETDDAFIQRADDFVARAAAGQLSGLSTGLRKVFEEEFGVETGRKLFLKDLDKELQGGLRVVFPESGGDFKRRLLADPSVAGQVNAGGLLTQKVAERLGLPGILTTTEKATKAFMKLKNTLRSDPNDSKLFGLINKSLNQVGTGSEAWSAFVRAVAREASDTDLSRAFKGFQEVQQLRALNDAQAAIAQPTRDLLIDLGRLEKIRPDAYARALELAKDPELADSLRNAATKTDVDEIALNIADRFRTDYDRYVVLQREAGAELGYQDNYIPLLYTSSENQEKMLKVLTGLDEGYKNLPGRGLDFTKERTAFMKDVVDPATGQTVKKAMTPSEAKKYLISIGQKDAADLIIDDPIRLLMTYSANVSKNVAIMDFIRSAKNKQVLFRTDIAQLDVDPARLESVIGKLKGPELEKVFGDFLNTPGALVSYFDTLNTELVAAYKTGDKAAIKAVDAKVNELITALSLSRDTIRGSLLSKNRRAINKAAAKGDEEALERLNKQASLLTEERQYLSQVLQAVRSVKEGYLDEPVQYAKTLGGQFGDTALDMRAVGTGKELKNSFYLPQVLEKLAGEDALVTAIERALLLRNPKFNGQLNQAVDAYMNFFRASATFGKGTGFGIRNGVSAVQSNMTNAGSQGTDFVKAGQIVPVIIMTERGLQPFSVLRREDIASKRLDRLAKDGALSPDQVKVMRDDLELYGSVQTATLRTVHEQVLEKLLSKIKVADNITGWDAYKTAERGEVFKDFNLLQGALAQNFDDDSAMLLNLDPERFVVNAKKVGAQRGVSQKVLEGALNFGFEVEVASLGRRIKIRPIQNYRDFNQMIEYYNRMTPIVTGLKRFGNTEEGRDQAVMLMKAAQFDYQDLTETERVVLRRWMMPFWTWTRNNVPTSMRAVFNDPQRVANNFRGWDLIRSVLSDENGDLYFVPDYVSEMGGFILDDDVRQGLLEDKPAWLDAILTNEAEVVFDSLIGNPIALRPESPVLDLEKLTAGGVTGNVQETFSGANPIAKAILQGAFQKNMFTGKNYTERGVKAPVYIEKIIRAAAAIDPAFTLGSYIDPETGDVMIDEAWYDGIKGILPILGTNERTLVPVVEALYEASTGNAVDWSGSQSDRAVTNLLSTIAGLNVITVTPETEISTLKDEDARRNNAVRRVAAQHGVSQKKLNAFISEVLQNNPGIDNEVLFEFIEDARQSGALDPDYLSEPEQ